MIIHSLLDTDLYKFTMMQVVLHRFPGRGSSTASSAATPASTWRSFAGQIREEVRSLCSLQFTRRRAGLPAQSMRFIKSDFVDFLGLFRLNEKYIDITPQPSGELDITHQGAVAPHHPVRDPGAGDRQRGLLPQHAEAARHRGRPPPPRDQDRRSCRPPACADLQDRRLRHAPALLEGLARRGAAHPDRPPRRGDRAACSSGASCRSSPAPATCCTP